MRILVTGGTGFIGQHLVRYMLKEGHEPVTLSRREPANRLCDHITADAGSLATRRAVKEFDAVVHLAGIADASSSLKHPYLYNKVNSLSTLNILEGCRKTGTRFVLASSQRVYQPSPHPIREDTPLQPVDPYGVSKMVAEEWTQMCHRYFSLPTTILRFFSVYGPGLLVQKGTSGVASIFLQRALMSEDLEVHGQQLRDFTYVEDVAVGILKALANSIAVGKTYNIATGKGTSLEELARFAKEVTGSKSKIVVKEANVAGANYVADVTKAKQDLDYESRVELSEGLNRYAEWLREHTEPVTEVPSNRKPTRR